MRGEKEIEYGRMAPIVAYPFVDNGGGTIAVISFVGTVEDNREILTETAFLSLQVPMDFHSMYRPLSIQDGVVLVNCNGVVIYGRRYGRQHPAHVRPARGHYGDQYL